MTITEARRVELRNLFCTETGITPADATILSHLAMAKLETYAADIRNQLTTDDTLRAGARGDCSLTEPCDTCLSSTRRILAAVRVHLSGRSL